MMNCGHGNPMSTLTCFSWFCWWESCIKKCSHDFRAQHAQWLPFTKYRNLINSDVNMTIKLLFWEWGNRWWHCAWKWWLHFFMQDPVKQYITCKHTVSTIMQKFYHGNWAQWAQEWNQPWTIPTGTACLIGKHRLLEHMLKWFSTCTCSPRGTKTSQMGVTNHFTPECEISHPKIPPQCAQQRAKPPKHHIWHCL